jgi:TonB-linked SusC/RagA family outer membrane protein
MKLMAMLLLGACLQIHAAGYGQRITLSEKDAPIEKVLKKIQQQTSYKFLYTSQLLEGAPKISITVKNAPVEEALDLIFKGQLLEYEVNESVIVIRPKVKTKIASLEATLSDPIDVSGKVTDGEGRPLPGANVKVRGTNIGVTTDNNGNFVLKNVSENAVLEISFVGHEMKTFTVRGKGFINVALSQKLSLLDETVVIAYGTTSRRFATGNIATVKAVDIEKQPVQNPLLALQGRVPGIEITQLTGMNGGGLTVRIQGRNSLRLNALDPLIVIDGVPYPTQLNSSGGLEALVQSGSPLNFVNPADIESIDILKDADATAIYGSRAANGAILITTKKGNAGRTKLSINMQQGWGKITRKADVMNTQQYLEMRYEAFKNDALIPSSTPNSTSPYLYAPDLTIWDTTRYTDWQKVLIGNTASYSNINTNISGGSTNIQYLIGVTYNRQTTVFPGDFDDKKGGLHFSINGSSPNQKLRVQLTGTYMYDQNHLPGVDLTQTAVLMEPNAPPIYNENGTHNWAPNAAGNSTWINPLAYTISSDFKNATFNLVSNANFSYQILPNLKISSGFGYTNMENDIYQPFRLESVPPESRAQGNRLSNFGKRNMRSWIIEPQIIYNYNIGKGKIEGLLGGSWQQNSSDILVLSGSGYSNDQLMKSLVAATTKTVAASSSLLYKYNAFFGRLNFNWSNKYLINVTARQDGSSRFGEKNKFHIFGSIGLGWIFTEEKFIKENIPFLSFGKLKTSVGTTGNDQLPDYLYISTYGSVNLPIPYQNAPGLLVSSIPNPHLQWEDTHKWLWGVDLGFLNDRIVLGAAYALNKSTNQIIGYVVPAITGFSSINRNFPATIRNTSLEFTLNTINTKGRIIKWSSNFNFTIPRNKLLSFPNIEQTSYGSDNLGVIVGEPLGITQVFPYAGVDPTIGKYMVLNQAGNPTLSPNGLTDRTALVSTLTKFYGGLLNTISFKGIQLEFLLQFVYKNGIRDFNYWNGSRLPGVFSSGSSNQPVSVLNRWQKIQDNAPVVARFTARNNSFPVYPMFSDVAYNYDASFIRLKNVSLSWQLPTHWIQKAKLQSFLFYFRGENLATITKYSGMDPETQSSVILPPLQMWTIGMKLEL